MSKNVKKHVLNFHWIPFFAGVFSISISLILGVLTLLYVQQLAQRDAAGRVIQTVDEMGQALLLSAQQLNDKKFTRCDSVTLLAMRKSVLMSEFIMDVAFFEGDKQICTASDGVLFEAIELPASDYDSVHDADIWLNYDIYLPIVANKVIQTVLIRKGQYSLMVDPRQLSVESDIFDWQFVGLTDLSSGDFKHVQGTPGIWQKNASSASLFSFRYQRCSEDFPHYCTAVSITPSNFMLNNIPGMAITAFISLLVGIVSYGLVLHQVRRYRSVPSRVKRGLKHGHFYWLLQPIVQLRDEQIVGVEVLARFKDPVGDLFPDEFIPVLRDMNLSWSFTEQMFRVVLAEINQRSGIPLGFRVSFNVFPSDVESGRLQTVLSLQEVDATLCRIALEITEDEYLEYDAAQRQLASLRRAGFAISIDDFGTGYSNLKHLKSLNGQYLKIDRSFVQDLETEGLKSSLIPNMVTLANQFSMAIIAEGIEECETAKALHRLGVEYGQGWLFGKPMTLNDLVARFFSEQDETDAQDVQPSFS